MKVVTTDRTFVWKSDCGKAIFSVERLSFQIAPVVEKALRREEGRKFELFKHLGGMTVL